MTTADPLQELRERYRASAGTIVAGFSGLVARLAADPTSPAVLEELRADLHRVRGTAGSYGFTGASRLAFVLEERVLLWIGNPSAEAAGRVGLVEEFVRHLEDSFA